MRKKIWVDPEFEEYLKKFKERIEYSTGKRISDREVTKIIANVHNPQKIMLIVNKKKRKKKVSVEDIEPLIHL